MAKLTLKDRGESDLTGLSADEIEFQAGAAKAKEPDMLTIAVGDQFNVYTPYFRESIVTRAADAEAEVLSTGGGTTWREIWSVEEVEQIGPRGVRVSDSHVIVTEAVPDFVATPLVSIDDKTKKQRRKDLSIVEAILVKKAPVKKVAKDEAEVKTETKGPGRPKSSK